MEQVSQLVTIKINSDIADFQDLSEVWQSSLTYNLLPPLNQRTSGIELHVIHLLDNVACVPLDNIAGSEDYAVQVGNELASMTEQVKGLLATDSTEIHLESFVPGTSVILCSVTVTVEPRGITKEASQLL